MACIEVFAAGDCLARTAGGRTGRRGSLTLDLGAFRRLRHGEILWQLDVLLIGMDIFWNKQVRKFSYNTIMFYVSYYLAYGYGL